ncbi:MAG TPA: glycosyltransferase family 9 protein [Gemmatimonadaceae bacterium]
MSLRSILVTTGMRSVVKLMRLAGRMGAHGPSTATAASDLPVADARRILVVALAEIGDAVLLSPFLRELRRLAPRAHITLVHRPVARSLYARCPYVDQTLTYEPRVARLLRPVVLPLRAWRFARRMLGGPAFDVAIVPRWDTDHHFASAVAFWSGAARRIGYSELVNARKATLNAGFDGLLTDAVPTGTALHEVERHFALLRYMGATPSGGPLELWLDEEDERKVDEQLSRSGVESGAPRVAMVIGAADPKRRWPIERFTSLAAALLRRYPNAQVLIIGGSEDVAAQSVVVEALQGHALPLAGRLTLRESAAALSRCVVAVGNDSGALHLAAGVRVPCVEISCHPANGDVLHNNAPERFGPWGVPSTIVRPGAPLPPCSSACVNRAPHCILGVEVDEALAAVLAFVERASLPGAETTGSARRASGDTLTRPAMSPD